MTLLTEICFNFWELFTMIPCAPKDFKRQRHHYLKLFSTQIKNEGYSNVEKIILWFLAQKFKKKKEKLEPQRMMGKNFEVVYPPF